MKEKKRYVVYELLSKEPLGGNADRDVLSHLNTMLGMYDSAKAGLLPISYDGALQVGVLRVEHDSVDKVKGALMLLKRASGKDVVPRVRGVSGILAKTERFVPKTRTQPLQAQQTQAI
jgi:RNase P/RNase MRP subunit POP5